MAYSEGRAVVPPVGELLLEKGEVHIKYGYIEGDDFYVIKIASGFYGNPKLGIPSGNGLMLLFSQQTGELVCTLKDEGLLTDVRTAVAGAIASKYLAPVNIQRIGIVGTGMQNTPGFAARMFSALGEKGINIQLITTSEIRITCVIDEKQVKDAVRALHRAFELDTQELA